MQKIGIIVEAKKQLQAVLAGAKDLDVLDSAARAVIQDFANLSAGSKAIDNLQKEYMDLARSIDVARKSSKDHSSAQINELKGQREELKRVVAAAKELESAQVAGTKPGQVKALEKLKKEGVAGVETGADAVKEYGDKLAEVEKQIKSLQESGGKLTKEQVEGFKKQEVAIAATQKALRDLLRGGIDPWSRKVEGVLKRSTDLIKKKQEEIKTLQKRTEDADEKELIGINKKIKAAEAYIDVMQDAHRESAKLPDVEKAKLGAIGVAGRGAVKVGIAGAAGEVGDIEKVREQGSAAMDRLKGLGKMALGGGIVAFLLSSVRTWAQIDTELLKVQRRFGDIEGSVWSLSNRLGFTKREMMELSREYGKISNVFEREGMGATIGYARTMGVPAAAAIRLREVGRYAERPVDMKRYLSALERQGKELGLDRGRQEEMFNILITQQQRMAQQVFGGYGSEGVPMGVMQGMDYLWGGTERGRGIRGLDYTTRLDEAMKDVSSDAVRFFKYRAYGLGQQRKDSVTGEMKTVTITDVIKRIEAGIYGFGPGGESNLQALLGQLQREYGAGALGEEQYKLIAAELFKPLKMFEIEPLLDLKEKGRFSSKARETLTRYGKAQGITEPKELEDWMTGIQKELMGKTETEQAKILEGYLRPGAKGVLLEATKLDKTIAEQTAKIEELKKAEVPEAIKILSMEKELAAHKRTRAGIVTDVGKLAPELAGAGFVEWDEFWERFGKAPKEMLEEFGKDFETAGSKFVSTGESVKLIIESFQRETIEGTTKFAKALVELLEGDPVAAFKSLKEGGADFAGLMKDLAEQYGLDVKGDDIEETKGAGTLKAILSGKPSEHKFFGVPTTQGQADVWDFALGEEGEPGSGLKKLEGFFKENVGGITGGEDMLKDLQGEFRGLWGVLSTQFRPEKERTYFRDTEQKDRPSFEIKHLFPTPLEVNLVGDLGVTAGEEIANTISAKVVADTTEAIQSAVATDSLGTFLNTHDED